MDPVEALRAIAYRLETDGAPAYRVRAFRRAAATVEACPADRLAALAASGRLQELEGVGEVTAQVIGEALAGRRPGYLSALEVRAGSPLAGAPAALRNALRGDCHLHSDWSDGGSPIEEMASAAAGLGHEYAVLTDHSPRLTVAHGLDAERLRRQLGFIAGLEGRWPGFRLLSGIEVDVLPDGTLDQEEALLAGLDLVVASVHSKLRMESREMTERMIAAVSSPHVDVLGHCTGRLLSERGRPPSSFDAARVFAACAANGTAVEINCRPERQDPPEELIALALEAGCLFSIDTDAHAPGQLEWLGLGCQRAAAIGVPPDRVINTWPLERLLDWGRSGPAR